MKYRVSPISLSNQMIMTKRDPRERRHVLTIRERRHELLLVAACAFICLFFFVKILFF